MSKLLHKKQLFNKIIVLISVAIPCCTALLPLLSGDMTLWYDNARDLLSAWNNLGKPTLIGPTSGIPGIFYGPYWIWLLSIGLLVSKDPRVVTLITATLPYFVLFPLIWFKFSRFFGLVPVIIGWLLFIFTSGMTYATQLWNPYPAPLMALAVIYLLLTIDFKRFSRRNFLMTLLLGFLLGLIINFHISFGIGFSLGVLLFFLVDTIFDIFAKKAIKKILLVKLLSILIVGVGLCSAFIPFLLFEFRHGFNQLSILLHALSNYGDALVGVKGLTKSQIIQEFVGTFGKLLNLPTTISSYLLISSVGLLALLTIVKKIRISEKEIKIITLVLSLISGVAYIYLTAKNPVWAYHFIGVDIIFLILITLLAAKILPVRLGLIFWLIPIIFINIYTVVSRATDEWPSELDSRMKIIENITQDAGNSEYTVFAYSPSIYTYEYSYLFLWLAGKDIPYDPSKIISASETIYLIVPQKKNAEELDFINYRAPDSKYKTAKMWPSYFGTTIIKKVKKN